MVQRAAAPVSYDSRVDLLSAWLPAASGQSPSTGSSDTAKPVATNPMAVQRKENDVNAERDAVIKHKPAQLVVEPEEEDEFEPGLRKAGELPDGEISAQSEGARKAA